MIPSRSHPGAPALVPPLVFVDAVRGIRGDYDDWVAEFARKWQCGRESTDTFMDLMGPDIRLIAPGLRTTIGRTAGTDAFRKAFAVMPDLTASVSRWAARHDGLFIEMTFKATIGGHQIAWANVDRFLFVDGYAVERVAYFNPLKVRTAFMRSPAGWLQLLKRRWVGL